MRFIHIADVHIGMQPDKGRAWSAERAAEIITSFEDIIRICNEEKTELLLIAGDLFHKQPLVRELKEVNYLFGTLTGTRVVLIAGNHDYISARSPYNDFVWNENVTMLASHEMGSVYIEELNTEVYGLSFHTREIHEPLFKGLKPTHRDRINILLAHGGEPGNLPVDKKELAAAGFDYVAFGHLHKPQDINERIRYTGSFEPLDKNETGERGFIRGELIKSSENTAEVTALNQVQRISSTELAELTCTFVPHAVRSYIKEEIRTSGDLTDTELRTRVRGLIEEHGEKNIYCFRLRGFRPADHSFDKEQLMKLGNVLEIQDETVPDYDFEALGKENADNLIGMYIKRISENGSDETTEKALYYGLEALLRNGH